MAVTFALRCRPRPLAAAILVTLAAAFLDGDDEFDDVSFMQIAMEASKVSQADAPVVECAYDAAQVVEDEFGHQEPGPDASAGFLGLALGTRGLFFFTPEDWQLHGKTAVEDAGNDTGVASRNRGGAGHFDQRSRIASLDKIFSVIPVFFDRVLPSVAWWATSGTLIGAIRAGSILPWDNDGDIAVDFAVFDTEETWNHLKAASNGSVHHDSCTKRADPLCTSRGDCPACFLVPMPADVDPAGDVVLAVQALPPSSSKLGDLTVPARFVDLRTGFGVDVMHEGQFPDLVLPLQQCMLGANVVNLPSRPVDYLFRQYGGHGRTLDEETSAAANFRRDTPGSAVESKGSVLFDLALWNCSICTDRAPGAPLDAAGAADFSGASFFRAAFAPATSSAVDGYVLWEPVRTTASAPGGRDCVWAEELDDTSSLPAGMFKAEGRKIYVRETCVKPPS